MSLTRLIDSLLLLFHFERRLFMSNYYHLPVVGIDIAANFSIVTALKPDGDIYQKNLRIEHTLCGFKKLLTFLQKLKKS